MLGTKLQGLKLPSDSSCIQGIINDYLNEMFNNEGDFRQGLTQSEDYILQAALSLLNAQQSITKEITPDIILQEPKPKTQSPIIQTGLKKRTISRDLDWYCHRWRNWRYITGYMGEQYSEQ